MTKASICTIGDEILIGQIVDTNSSNISKALNTIGVQVTRMVSLSDNEEDIITSLTEELSRNEIVIVTGGLGPVHIFLRSSARDLRRHNRMTLRLQPLHPCMYRPYNAPMQTA